MTSKPHFELLFPLQERFCYKTATTSSICCPRAKSIAMPISVVNVRSLLLLLIFCMRKHIPLQIYLLKSTQATRSGTPRAWPLDGGLLRTNVDGFPLTSASTSLSTEPCTRNPETSDTQSHTAFLIADYLRSSGLEVHMGTGAHGIAGVFTNGDGDGKAILMRAERGGKLLVV